jgi:formiminotetrahydrofolate cyclodeaminase
MDTSFNSFDASRSIAGFLNATAAKQPAPGGGSVTALVGALAAAIGEMVLNYSVGKKNLSPDDDQRLQIVLRELTRSRQIMLELMIEDQAAFASLSAARKIAKAPLDHNPEFATALLACIRIPQTIGATAAAMLDLCGSVTPIANKFLLSDLAVCAELSMATIRCAAYNVHVNLADVSDADERQRFEESTAEMLGRATVLVKKVIPAIWDRLE